MRVAGATLILITQVTPNWRLYMSIIYSIGRRTDLIAATLANGKRVFGTSVKDLETKLEKLAEHWNYSADLAKAEFRALISSAKQNSQAWALSSKPDGSFYDIENFLIGGQ